MRVLIALDTSATAQAALAATLARRWSERTSFKVLTVLPTKKFSFKRISEHPGLSMAHLLIDAATTSLEKENEDSIVVGHVDAGDPASRILALASAWTADLIVVGSHDRNKFERLFLGSVSRKVLDGAQCSVLIARPPEKTNKNRVLIATDHSVNAKLAVSQVLKDRWDANTEFHLVTVMEDAGLYAYALEPNATASINTLTLQDEYTKDTQTHLEAAKQRLDDAFGKNCADYSILHGPPAAMILDAARTWQAGLIVVGSASSHGLFGSVSKGIAGHAPCSVQVVRSNVHQMSLPQYDCVGRIRLPEASCF